MSRIDQHMTSLARVNNDTRHVAFVGFRTLLGTQQIVDGPSRSSTGYSSQLHIQ